MFKTSTAARVKWNVSNSFGMQVWDFFRKLQTLIMSCSEFFYIRYFIRSLHMSFLVVHTVKTIEWTLSPILTSDFFSILGELTCGRDIDYLCGINIDTLKASTSVTNKELPNKLEFTPLVNSLGDIYETNRKLFIQSGGAMEHWNFRTLDALECLKQ